MTRIRLALISALAATGFLATGLAVTPAGAAQAATCHTSYRSTHTTSTTGQTWTAVKEISCGTGHLAEWRHVYHLSTTGAHYTENGWGPGSWWDHGTPWKIETSVGHYQEWTVKVSVTKAGKVTITRTYYSK